MDLKALPLYFLGGGLVVMGVTYFGSHGKGPMAAFIALLPSISIITIVSIYSQSGQSAATNYARDLLKLFPAWLLYAVTLALLLPRIGLVGALGVGVGVYLISSLAITRFI
jgi:uncharacterized membrane protein (GlpM family)